MSGSTSTAGDIKPSAKSAEQFESGPECIWGVIVAELKVLPPGCDKTGLARVLDGSEYDIPGLDLGPHPVILDLGANVGAFACWAAERWPDSTIFCYEPHPDNYAALKVNAPDNCQLRKVAVSHFDGKAPFYLGLANNGEGSLVLTGDQDKTKAGVVKVAHANKLPPADFLKLDTEGSEWDILTNYTHLEGVKAIALEWHSHEDRNRIRAFLAKAGFKLVSDTEWCWLGRGNQKWVRPERKHLFVGILAGGGKSWGDFDASLQALQQLAPQAGITVTVVKDYGTGVDRARNRLIAQARADKSVTHFMFIDDDIVFHPAWVINMVYSNMDIVAGAYPRKQINWAMVAAAVKNGVPTEELSQYSGDWIINSLISAEGGGFHGHQIDGIGTFVQAEEVGTGFLMFKMAVVEKMIAEFGDELSYVTDYEPRGEVHHMIFACWRDWVDPREVAKRRLVKACLGNNGRELVEAIEGVKKAYSEPVRGRYLTEDYQFCRCARSLGYTIFIYLDASVRHIGTHTYEGALKNYLKQAPVGSEPPTTVQND